MKFNKKRSAISQKHSFFIVQSLFLQTKIAEEK